VRAWLDENLEPLIRKLIPMGIDPPSALLPHRLDKPVYTTTSKTYADVLKKQFSLASNTTITNTNNTQPLRKRTATLIDYDSDQLQESPYTGTPLTNTHSNATTAMIPPATTPNAYAMELLSLKQELAQLKTAIVMAVEQILTAIASIHATKSQPTSNDMETESASTGFTLTTDTLNTNSHHLDIPAIITKLCNDRATINSETRALFHQYLPPKSTNTNSHSPAS